MFEQGKFNEKLIKWVVKKYLPYNFFDDDDSQDLFHYLNPSAILPLRSQLKALIENQFTKKHEIIMSILRSNLSKISFTLDGWTSITNRSYYGITGHFIDDNWILQSLIIDFCQSRGEHTGKDIANCFLKVIDNYELSNKIMGITVDNASANTKFMVELSGLLPSFDSENQHFRCAAHILNLSTQDMFSFLKIDDAESQNEKNMENDGYDEEDEENGECQDISESEEMEDIETVPTTSPLSKLRGFFKIVKRSEQWRNKLKIYCETCNITMLAPNIDVSTRWNLTHDMIYLALKMQLAINLMCNHNQALKNFRITDYEWELLKETYKYLRHFKVLTKVFSGDKYPTLNAVVLGFNMLLDKLEASISTLYRKTELNPIEDNMLAALEAANKIETFEKTSWGKEMEVQSVKKFKRVFKNDYFQTEEEKQVFKIQRIYYPYALYNIENLDLT